MASSDAGDAPMPAARLMSDLAGTVGCLEEADKDDIYAGFVRLRPDAAHHSTTCTRRSTGPDPGSLALDNGYDLG